MSLHGWSGHEDKERSLVQGSYEYYFTDYTLLGYPIWLKNVVAIIPNQSNNDEAEIGVERDGSYRALEYNKPTSADYKLTWQGEILVPPSSRVYLKVTGTTVDDTVRLEAFGDWEDG
jgi:hypothetical protein